MRRKFKIWTVVALAAALGACANDNTGNFLTTAALLPSPTPAPQPIPEPSAYTVDPSCAPLATRIEQLRQDQSVAGLEKASTGKTRSVSVKRASLAHQAELNKANFEFQAKCMGPQPRSAAAPAIAPTVKAAQAKVATEVPQSIYSTR